MKITVGLCLFAFVGCTGAFAQSVAGSGAVTGMVRDQYQDGLPSAKIVLSNEALGIHIKVTSTDDGVFDMPSLPPHGNYKLHVTRTGFANWDSNEFDVSMGQTVYLKVDMKVEEPATPLEAARAISAVDDNRPGVSTLITHNQLDSLPLNTRRLDSPVLLAPTTTVNNQTQLIGFRGGDFTNVFLLDGLTATDFFNPLQPGIANQIAPDAVAEVQVLVANGSAEFGHAAGGIINAATRTGGNSFHGDGYGYYSTNQWSASDRFALGQKLFQKQTEAGGSIGGPVMHDKLFFFLNGDELNGRFNDMNRITTPLLTDAAGKTVLRSNCGSTVTACTAAINLIQPQMNVVSPLSEHWTTAVARIDYRRSNGDAFSLMANAMDSSMPVKANTQAVAPNGGLLGLNNSTIDTRFANVSWLHTFFPGGVNQLRAGWSQDRIISPASTQNLSTGLTGLTVDGATVGSSNPDITGLTERHYQVSDSFSWTSFSHSVKVGVEYFINRDYITDLANPWGSYAYPSLTGFATDLVGNNQRNYTSFSQTLGVASRHVQEKQQRAFAQDTWKVIRKLTVTGGVNWEKTKVQQPSATNPTYYETQTISSRTADFAPRLSVAYEYDPRTVIRLSYGWFFDPIPGTLVDSLRLGNGLDQYSLSSVPYQSNAPVFPKYTGAIASIPAGLQNIWFAASKFRNPYTQQMTLAIERRVSRDTDVTLNLNSSRGYKLYSSNDTNLISPTVAEIYTVDNAAGSAVNTWTTLLWTTSTVNATNTSTTTSLHTADPNHEHVYQINNDGASWYDSASLQIRKQVGRELSVQVSYAFSHSIDNVSGSQVIPGVPLSTSPGDTTDDKGNSASDQRHRGALNFVWTPRILRNDSAAARILANGWQVAGLATLASPQSVTPLVLINGQQVAGVTMEYMNSMNASGGWNRASFEPVGSLKLGAQYTVNARVAKIIAATDRIRATFAFEGYNLLNNQFTTSVNNIAYVSTLTILHPVTGAGSANGSSAYPYGSTARRAQISLRFQF